MIHVLIGNLKYNVITYRFTYLYYRVFAVFWPVLCAENGVVPTFSRPYGGLRSFAVTLRSRVTATRKFEIVGKWRFLCYEHVTRVLIRVKGVCFCVFSTPCQRYLCRVREVSHSETTIPPYWVFSLHGLDVPAARASWIGNRETNHEGVPTVGFPVARP